MKLLILATVFLFIAGLVAWFGNRSQPTHTVTRVLDGDTVELSSGVTIRIQGIDAPETNQPGGAEAKEALNPIEGHAVTYQKYDTDRYGRIVARIYYDGEDLGLLMLRAGHAWHYAAYSSDSDYERAEREARENLKGLWAGTPVAPWEWRNQPTNQV